MFIWEECQHVRLKLIYVYGTWHFIWESKLLEILWLKWKVKRCIDQLFSGAQYNLNPFYTVKETYTELYFNMIRSERMYFMYSNVQYHSKLTIFTLFSDWYCDLSNSHSFWCEVWWSFLVAGQVHALRPLHDDVLGHRV